MTTTTLVPNATVSGTPALVGGATVHAVLADESNASYADWDDNSIVQLDFGTFTLNPAGVFKRVVASWTATLPGGGSYGQLITLLQASGVTLSSAPTSVQVTQHPTGDPLQGAVYTWSHTGILSQAQVDTLRASIQLDIAGSPSYPIRGFRLRLLVTEALPPVVAVSGPQGNITTNLPTVTWAHTPGSDGDVQSKYEVKVYTDAQYTAGGFNPASSSPTWTSGVTAGAANNRIVGSALANNDTYRAYVRTAQTINGVDQWAPWTFSEFTINIKPTTAGYSPVGTKSWVPGAQLIDWTFAHQLGGMNQTAYRVIVRRGVDNSLYFDTGKVTSSTTSHNVPSWEPLTTSSTYYWTVQVWDTNDVASDVSAPQYITFLLTPTVVVDNPSVDEVLTTAFDIEWHIDNGDGSPSQSDQAAWRVLIYEDGLLVNDTGWNNGTADQWTPPSYTIFVPGSEMVVEVRLRDTLGVEGTSGLVPFTVAWPAPASPSGGITVNTAAVDTDGAAVVSWNGAVKDGAFVEWRIYRRLHNVGLWTLLGTSTTSANPATFNDYFFESGFSQDWAVTQVALRFGAEVESTKATALDIEATSSKYWIFDFDDPDNYKIMLDNVTTDSFEDEFETFETRVIGRGRRFEVGDNDGMRGTLTEQERTPVEASPIKAALTALKLRKRPSVIRTPFGDTIKVFIGSISYSRISGVGRREMLDITIPYAEVF